MEYGNERFPFRQLTENEQKLLILIFELEFEKQIKPITKEVLVNYAMHKKGENRTRRQVEASITNSLSSIQKISKDYFGKNYRKESDRYVVSISNVDGRKTGYRLADEWLITAKKTAEFSSLLIDRANGHRINLEDAKKIGINLIKFTEEEADYNIDLLLKAGYLRKEVAIGKITERLSLYERKYLEKLKN